MRPIEFYVKRSMSDNEHRRTLAGSAIAQFLVMREGLKGRIVDGGLDATAASLTAAVMIGAAGDQEGEASSPIVGA